MDAARALADLVETSPQIEAATVFDSGDEPLGSTGVSDWWATAVARAGRALLENAGVSANQIHASLADGDVFVAGTAGGRGIVAVTAPHVAPGLLFYDLKRCLFSIADPDPEPEPVPDPEPAAKKKAGRWGRRKKDAA